ncbi:hypothetical protein Tco_0529278 [Tanacetum coccineum]
MAWVEQLETHLHDLYLLNAPYAIDAFKPAFRSFFGEEHQTFRLKMFHNLDQLRLQLERENLHGINAKTCLQALRTQFKEFLASKGVNATDLLNQGWQQDFEDFTRCEPSAYRRELLENLDTLEAVIHKVVNTYAVLRMKENEVNALKENGSQLHDEILHEHQIKSSVKMQSQDIQIKPVQAMDDSLIVSKGSLIEPENNDAFSKSEIETHMQRQEEKVDMREVVDAGCCPESSGTKPDKQNTSSSSGSYTTQAVDADIRPVIDEEPFAEVQLTALHNILANEQQHTEQSEPSYDTHLLETIESNTTPTSTNMCHRGGEIDQDALLKTELLKTKDMVDKEIYNELSKRFYNWKNIVFHLKYQIQQGRMYSKYNHNGIGQMFSLNKSSAVHEKPHTPRSCLRWKPTGRIFKTVRLRWIPTGKVFIDSTTKVDSEPPNGSNDDITNPYECNQTLYVSAGTSNSSAGLVLHLEDVWINRFKPRSLMSNLLAFVPESKERCTPSEKRKVSGPVLHEMMSDHNCSVLAPQRQEMSVENVSSGLVPQGQKVSDYDNSDPVPPRQNVVPTAEKIDSSQQGLEFLSVLYLRFYNPTHEIGESSSSNIDNTDVHSDKMLFPTAEKIDFRHKLGLEFLFNPLLEE